MRNISDIPPWNHTPASKEKKKLFPQVTHRYPQNIRLISYNSCDISFCSFAYYKPWASYGCWCPQGATLALQPCHAMHRLSHQAGTNPRWPPTAAALTSRPWLERVRDHEEFANRWPVAHNKFLPSLKDCTNSPLHECVPCWGDGGGTIHPSHRAGLALVHGVTTICHVCLLSAFCGMQTVDGGMKTMKVYIEVMEKLLVTSWLMCKHGSLVRPWAWRQVQCVLNFVMNCHISKSTH